MSVSNINKPTLAIGQKVRGHPFFSVLDGVVMLVKPCDESLENLWFTDPLTNKWKRCHRNSLKARGMLIPLEELSVDGSCEFCNEHVEVIGRNVDDSD